MEKEENHSKKTIDSLVLEQALISVYMMSITNLLRKKERIRILKNYFSNQKTQRTTIVCYITYVFPFTETIAPAFLKNKKASFTHPP